MIPIPELLMAVAMAVIVSKLLSFSIISSDPVCTDRSIHKYKKRKSGCQVVAEPLPDTRLMLFLMHYLLFTCTCPAFLMPQLLSLQPLFSLQLLLLSALCFLRFFLFHGYRGGNHNALFFRFPPVPLSLKK